MEQQVDMDTYYIVWTYTRIFRMDSVGMSAKLWMSTAGCMWEWFKFV